MQRGCESNVSAVKSPRPNHQSCCETTISTTCQVYFDVMRHPRSRTCQVCGNNDNPATSTTMRHQQQHSGSELKTPLVGHLRLDFTTTTHRQYNNNATTTQQHTNNTTTNNNNNPATPTMINIQYPSSIISIRALSSSSDNNSYSSIIIRYVFCRRRPVTTPTHPSSFDTCVVVCRQIRVVFRCSDVT